MIPVNFMRQGIVANGLQCSLLLFMSMSSCSCSRLVYFMSVNCSCRDSEAHTSWFTLKFSKNGRPEVLDCSCVTMPVVPAFPQVSEI